MFLKTIPNYTVAAATVAVGGFLNGYDTGSIGAIVAMSQWEKSIGKLSPTLLGVTVSLIMLAGAVPSFFAGQVADRFGHLRVIAAGTAFFVLGAILQGSSSALSQFLTGRAIAGLGEGMYLGNVSVYICEIAPVKRRGMLAGLPQFLATAGVCVGYFTCYGSVHIDSSLSWRLPYIIQAILGVILIGGCFTIPASPRWLISQNRRDEALLALSKLDFSAAEAEKDVLRPTEQRTVFIDLAILPPPLPPRLPRPHHPRPLRPWHGPALWHRRRPLLRPATLRAGRPPRPDRLLPRVGPFRHPHARHLRPGLHLC